MKYSKLFGKTSKTDSSEASIASHRLLLKGGFIRQSTAGRYYFLPIGMIVHNKIRDIIKDEMDKSGAQEMITPTLHPLTLWKETNRTTSVGFELMTIKDRSDIEFALGGTAEEMFVDVVRNMKLSYRDLPINLYQFSTKFRDEKRASGGLLRVREFIMKDAYTFDMDKETFEKEYEKMSKTYSKIFFRYGLKADKVEADNGYIGGEYCHEYVVETEVGESKYFVSKDGKYIAHEDVAQFLKEKINLEENEAELKNVNAVRGKKMEDGVKFHNKPLNLQIKAVVFTNEKNEFIIAIIRGDLDVNEKKLCHLSNSYILNPATDEEIRGILKSEPGFISPVGLKENADRRAKIKIICDDSLRTIKNAYGGSNTKNIDLININIDRDFVADIEGDIALIKDGSKTIDGKQELISKKGVEVGNIFQLGYHYSKKMKGAYYISSNGEKKLYYMGCYGIGLCRNLATIVEKHHDGKGIIWPMSVAPYQVHMISLGKEKSIVDKAEQLYNKLNEEKIEVLWDERDEVSAGVKFADADLIGIPIRLVISPRSIEKNGIEVKLRSSSEEKVIETDKVIDWIKTEIENQMKQLEPKA